MCYGNSRIESYDTEEVYSVSIFDKPVYEISLLVKDSREVVCLYFIESTYMNVDIFPDGFSDYTIYLKKQETDNAGDFGSPRFSLRGDYRSKIDQRLSLEKYERFAKRNDVVIKKIWKK